MRWIDRGPEPGGLQEYTRKFTQGWVEYFQAGMGGRPDDSHWREFREILGGRSGGNCWYCERRYLREVDDGGKSPTVDHFRPLNCFAELAYQWSNWNFSCRRCNEDNKGGSWPDSGYVDPSADDEMDRPERFFDYDADTGEIIPISGLPSEAREKAQRTIDDLGLNKVDVKYYRQNWIRQFVEDWQALPIGDRPAFAEFYTGIGKEYAGAVLMVLRQQWA